MVRPLHTKLSSDVSLNPAADALSLLHATACQIDGAGRLTWIDPTKACLFLQSSQPPSHFDELDLAVEGAAFQALRRGHPVRIRRPSNLEVIANVAQQIIVFREITALPPEYVPHVPRAANDPEALMLKSALADNRMCLFRQPIISSADNQVVRWECLSRLIQVDGRIVGPVEFIPAAERAGLVGELDIETLNLALSALTREQDTQLAINVSAGTIADAAACGDYLEILGHNQAISNRLTVEITESIAIHDLDAAARFGQSVRSAGARLALDDFGEGHTSFRSIRALPLDEIKIDGAYVQNIESRDDSRAFVIAIDQLARGLGMETVAERVETAEEAEALREIGVIGQQGYFYGKPRSTGK
ncbi:cyclic di-GMP phosphodiesterase PdeB [Candidatus Phycosocius bacilliformis]|uniref:Cyclic di-GMP phosphodiesterase PdeB n=1 Tax=Candidatus Phycosocius bacilliformis TaxID=1445552 RepID=A0A2P2EED1_9PROT|nr:EAL domain-containing protein [Candidatus Phycosocius bacilliformis]GBF59420.1 cyclic di-GMP phosphodiesterase PdeB [Candidatus Phycosocius bacilliformis]